ncbi:diguanylate cyclase domain-containing protein [Candidatus Formimonas warabiya]|nr:diguanylate cyclase [Candidatus Formimonas warabiya]
MESDAQEMLDLSPLPLCVIQNGLFRYANRSMVQLSGYLWEEMSHLTLEKLIFPGDLFSVHRWIAEPGNQEQIEGEQIRFRLLNSRGQVIQVVGFFRRIAFQGAPGVLCQIMEETEFAHGENNGVHPLEAIRLREVFDYLSCAVAVYEAVADGDDFVIKDFNLSAERIDKIEKKVVMGKPLSYVFPEIKKWGLFEVFQRVWRTGKAEHIPRYIYQDARTVGWRNTYVFKLGTGELVSVYDDITQCKQAEEVLKDSEKRFREIFSQSPIGIAIYNGDGQLMDANKACLDYFGLPGVDAVKGKELLNNFHIPKQLRSQLLDGETIKFVTDISFDRLRKKYTFPTTKLGRCYFDFLITPLKTERNTCYGFLMQVQDITAQKLAEEQLKYLSLHDSLTGSFNRAYFDQEMKRIEESRLDSVGIIMFDIDGLKLVNDTLGHNAGDALLVAGANVIKRCFRAGDIIARIGGDEFGVILPNSDQAAAETGCQRVQDAVSCHNANNPELPLSISMGYAVSSDVKNTANLLKQADDNLYREKLYRRQNAHNAVIQTLMEALKTKDFFTQGHAERLALLAEKFAQFLDLGQTTRNHLHLLAQFHDIGKVGICDSLLFKTEALTPEEETEIQRHCEIGHRIALSAPGLASVADLILKHHEWWNGEGYPLGLKGVAIPFECRVFSILDAFDCMISDRSYRKAMPVQDAIKALILGSGTQFDPFLANSFVEFVERELKTTS